MYANNEMGDGIRGLDGVWTAFFDQNNTHDYGPEKRRHRREQVEGTAHARSRTKDGSRAIEKQSEKIRVELNIEKMAGHLATVERSYLGGQINNKTSKPPA
jgi:hypothetical protein